MPMGAPLYPVARMRLSLTITAPTERREQVARVATARVIAMKYSSHEGRSCVCGSGICGSVSFTASGHVELSRQFVHARAQLVDLRARAAVVHRRADDIGDLAHLLF